MNDPLVGQQLDEYRLEALLGRGGMARVYRALDVRLKRYAAVKVIDVQFRDDSEYVKRFEIEAQAIAKLEHSLCRRHPLNARIRAGRQTQGTRRSFENSFKDVVRVPAIEQFNVKAHPGVGDDGFPELFHELRIQFPDAFAFHLNSVNQVRPP